ncbi:hypothetical protein BCR34DRAFT_650510 [Clohesyomyces aquaticus]|uniref:NACHT domain-containing protein n=1 Tax=Clohesyomyces aquaticus TaxID=1231657 RepID=A0A1Y1ZQU0_9PLEO|nr:hypothetical protein BCR34DRAFT_650510 [Clohesyomyces aquaticus]
MVLEALAAISLTGNIVQFVHFGCSLFSKGQQIYRSASGKTLRHDELQTIAQHIKDFSKRIDATVEQQKCGAGEVKINSDLVALAKRCGSVASELTSVLEKLGKKAASGATQTGGKESRGPWHWENFRAALQSIYKDDRIAELEERLERLRDQIMFHLVADLSSKQDLVLEILDTWKNESATRELETVNTLARLAQRLQTLNDAIPAAPAETLLQDLRQKFSEFSSLINHESRKLAILKSLRFDSMRVRKSTIAEAHKRTYEWIFTPEELPESDPRSRIKFLDWLKHGNDSYWVTGKPGSGKSTLMRFIENHSSTCRALDQWTGSTTLRKASFYFWNAGTEIHAPTSLKPLQGSLGLPGTFGRRATTSNFFFLIDGLDEYNGHHEEIVDILQDLNSSKNIKLCVSSRPWNRFEHAFGSSDERKLYLRTLTAKDIELFTKEQLLSQIKTLHLQEELSTYHSITDEIVARAKGVFLWVVLVVRSLRDGMFNDDSIEILQERLAALPTDLEPFFEHIINSVEVFYKKQMATSFLIALEALEPLTVIDYSFIEDEKSTLSFSLEWSPLSSQEIQNATGRTLKHLNRYKGLLEASPLPGCQIDQVTSVDFLHRTLRDFLRLPKPQVMLWSLLNEGFDVAQTMRRLLLSEAKLAHSQLAPRSFTRLFDFALYVTKKTGNSTYEFSVLDHIELIYDRHPFAPEIVSQSAHEFQISDHIELTYDRDPFVTRAAKQVYAPPWSILRIASHIGRIDYVKHKIVGQGHRKGLDHMLAHTLICRSKFSPTGEPATFAQGLSYLCSLVTCCFKKRPNAQDVSLQYEIAHTLIESGADPNALFNCRDLPLHSGFQPVWEGFFQRSLLLWFEYDMMEIDWDRILGFFAKSNLSESSTDLWANFLEECSTFPDPVFRHVIGILQRFMEHSLRPSTAIHGCSLFEHLLRNSMMNGLLSVRTRREVIALFLRHGANVNDIFLPLGQALPTWFERLLDHFKLEPGQQCDSVDFELLLKHGLDPNRKIDGITVWEHMLFALPRPFRDNNQVYCSTIALFLRYGADPDCEEVKSVITSMPNLPLDLVRLWKEELEYTKSREKSLIPWALNSNNTPVAGTKRPYDNDENDDGLQLSPNASPRPFSTSSIKRRSRHERPE